MQKKRSEEAKNLAEEIIRDIEKDLIQLDLICLKASRLALLANNPDLSEEFTKSAKSAGDSQAHVDAVEERFELILEEEPPQPLSPSLMDNMLRAGLLKKSAFMNPSYEYESEVTRKKKEINKLKDKKRRISSIKTKVYRFALNVYYKLRFSDVPERVFETTRQKVDKRLAELLPDAKEKFYSVYQNLESENKEDWSNAVHSCRRILQDVADKLYPPEDGESVESNGKDIDIGTENYINRLVLYAEKYADSKKFRDIVGSHLKYIGERLDAVYDAANKGSHTTIETKVEAERYVVYTYLLLGDILSLEK